MVLKVAVVIQPKTKVSVNVFTHIERANGKESYEMDNTVLLKSSKEKDIGVTISADKWKVSEQCGIAASY